MLTAESEKGQMQDMLTQIEERLQLLSDTASSTHTKGERSVSVAYAQYQKGARQLEATMHRLRQLGWARSTAATELSQCLTVVVLLSDLLANGQLVEADASDSYDLLNRNIHRATGCIAKMRG